MNQAEKLIYKDINELIPYANNTKIHSDDQIEKIASSLKEFGFMNPVLIDNENSVIAGHGRLLAARKIGLKNVPCICFSHLNEAQKKAYMIADNRLAEDAEWDDDLLKIELNFLDEIDFDLSLTGLSKNEMENLMISVSDEIEKSGLTDQDELPDNVNSITNDGDVWKLGEHILVCGDSTKEYTLQKLLKDNKADMVFTDPPYLMNYQGGIGGDGNVNKKQKSLKNDNLKGDDADQFLNAIAIQIKSYTHGAFYISFYRLGIDRLMNVLKENKLKWRNLIIWKKNHHNLSNSDYKSLYEPITYGWVGDYEPLVYGWNDKHVFYGGKGEKDIWEVSIPSVWEVNRPHKNDLHPTMKPVELCERAIKNSSKNGDIVLDLFGGSGSTLIACEKLGRRCRMIELDTDYCDVIINRWQNFTGNDAIHVKLDKTYNELSYHKEVS
ncbi:site-specific DNA-methyltransferase [Thiotrichales bacterium 19S3-7]|nr:site-specific DNA-methyltransferase [Thiotrichales bacterium 19S3-7]MCF6802795.1 site-specific DNA-methyltransferase [Thiotrichales bacterium 19S3-11]